ncbi:soluble lytic murein transglycosylase-like protein [Mizugakiibacter sediminis]|uniref:Lytic transglycosylase n=1 Tax=Mizugakiibacter sediminis TaxID=1475481 RepID=A0A0K8QJU6_9GAMM|nr:transglycosylase SLT domain-containing protein [Mizugakiibacter sediminis]GAP64976.1 soluble lytic murein transglycosylase-like protein [Mizugakiibacter sediminis]
MSLRLRVLSPLAAVVALAGCAASPSRPPAAPNRIDDKAVDALYAKLDEASRGYEDALKMQSGGDPGADAALHKALDELLRSAAQCGATAGCEAQRFFSTFDRLLRLKDGGELAGEPAEQTLPDTQSDEDTAGEQSPVLQAMPQAQRTVTLLRGHKLSDLIAMNGPVKAALEEWLTQMRPNLMDAWVNYQYLRYRMWPEYRKADLPEALLFGILAKESGGKVHAMSRSGAAGPLQFMYATGLRFGLATVNGFDERFDPALAARANAAYIDEQLKALNDNLEFVLAAYNGGEGRMRRVAAANPDASFWDPKIYFTLSPETREYVPMVLAAAWLFLHPERYNLEFPKVDGEPGQIELAQPASLAELTVCLGQAGGMRDGWFRTLRNLNPALNPQVEQPAGTRLQVPKVLEAAYRQSCAAGPWQTLAADLHEAALPAPPPETQRPRTYVVRRGDTLSSIVRKLGCSNVQALAELNRLRAPHYALHPGQALHLPQCARN